LVCFRTLPLASRSTPDRTARRHQHRAPRREHDDDDARHQSFRASEDQIMQQFEQHLKRLIGRVGTGLAEDDPARRVVDFERASSMLF
jgi:hypothetical protein